MNGTLPLDLMAEREKRERGGREEEGKEVKWKQCGIDKENAFHCNHITLHVFKNDVHLSEVVGVHGLLPDSLSKEHTQTEPLADINKTAIMLT